VRLFAQISYKGKHYHGWQNQPNAITVQSATEKAFNVVLRETEFNCTGCGRTDSGVHAKQFYFHFDTNEKVDVDKLVFKVNAILPEDIVVHRLIDVPEGSHTRFDAVSRTYQYYIHQKKNPFLTDISYYNTRRLDLEAMNEACSCLLNYADFTSFSKVNTETKTNNCDIKKALWKLEGESLVFEITANRFLRNMVRAIVGTMIEVGVGKITIDQFEKIIENKDRGKAGTSVPGHGLFLTKVSYPYIKG
jgi:tRNA pseudouridine38-40 synthase